MKKRIVIALGGNALQTGSDLAPDSQIEALKVACEQIVDIYESGYDIVLVHGNGPQVGNIFNSLGNMPFDVCGAMSQGYIGYHIQQVLRTAMNRRGYDVPITTVLTEVAVNQSDPAFQNPEKPIGGFYNADEAKKIAAETGCVMKEDAGRGWRRVVPSPVPEKIVQIGAIKELSKQGIVIACGGGGIPVVEKESGVCGVEAVIDKDFAACLLAQELHADILLILTAVENVKINYGTPGERSLSRIDPELAMEYADSGQFAAGSMLPKILAAVRFANNGGTAIIASLENAADAALGESGTIIRRT